MLPPQAFYLVDSAGGIHEAIDTYGRIKMATAIEIDDTDGILGNAGRGVGSATTEIWEIRSLSITSNAGDTYSVEDDGTIVSQGVAVGVGATGELVNVAPIPITGTSVITINSWAAADTWNIRAIRIL